jgi:hypothetical protein
LSIIKQQNKTKQNDTSGLKYQYKTNKQTNREQSKINATKIVDAQKKTLLKFFFK